MFRGEESQVWVALSLLSSLSSWGLWEEELAGRPHLALAYIWQALDISVDI